MFSERESELLAITETKLKGNWEVSWCGVNSISEGVPEIERDKRVWPF